MIKVETRNLSAMPYAQACVAVYNENSLALISYSTIVAEIDCEGWLTINGLYSATTRKHISAFMREYTPCDYYTAKELYENGEKLNILTGEVIAID